MSGLRWAEKLRQFNEAHSSKDKGMMTCSPKLVGPGGVEVVY